MVINPEKTIETIDSLISRIDDISEKEYNEKTTVKEFAEIVIDFVRFVRLSIKGVKERDWYPEYYDFTLWSRDGVRVSSEFWDYSKTITVGIAYDNHISELKLILNDCRKDFEMMQKMKEKKRSSRPVKKDKKNAFVDKFLPIVGNWDIDKSKVKYLNPDKKTEPFSYGLILLDERMKNGVIKSTVRFESDGGKTARIVYGYDSKTKSYYSIGIGGYNFAYVIDIFQMTSRGPMWKGLAVEGIQSSAIKADKDYELEVRISGLKIVLKIDGIEIFDFQMPEPPRGYQLGLFTWGKGGISFRDIIVNQINPKAFVIMKFQEPFNTLYNKVIKNVCRDMGIDAYRADEVYKPGVVLEDIIKGIAESEILIADITPCEHVENVYYEVGYAHALGKKTILLAEKSNKLPFDLQSYRVIFYDNIEGVGKKEFEEELKKHILSKLKFEFS